MGEHLLGAQEAGRDGDRRAPVLRQLLAQPEGEPDRRVLGQVVVHVPAVAAVGVRRAVGDLHVQGRVRTDQQGQEQRRGDHVRAHAEFEDAQAVGEGRLPALLPEDGPDEEVFAAPQVVDEDVEPPLFPVDPPGEGAYLVLVEVVGGHRDAGAAGLGDQLGGLLDGFARPADLAGAGPGGAAGDVHGRPGPAELDGLGTAGAAGGSRHEGDPAGERTQRLVGGGVADGRVLVAHPSIVGARPDSSCHLFPDRPEKT